MTQTLTKPKTAKSNTIGQAAAVAAVNSSRNVKVSSSNAVVKSNSETNGLGPASQTISNSETSHAYKSSGHAPIGPSQVGTKVIKVSGYEDAKGINERFIDLNKVSEGAPKISKPVLTNLQQKMLKSNDYANMKSQTYALRLGDQSAKTHSSNTNLIENVNAVLLTQRSNQQHPIGLRKS